MPSINPKTGRVQYQGGEQLPVVGSAAYNAAQNGNILPNNNTNFQMIDSNVLQGNGSNLQMPQTVQGMTPQQFVAGITPFQPTNLTPINPASGGAVGATTSQLGTLEGNRSQLINRLSQAQQQLLGKGAEQLRLEKDQGIPVLNKDIGALSEQIAAKRAAFDQAAVDVSGKPIGIERQTGKIAQIQRNEAVQIGGLSALLLAKQGNLESAKAEVDRTLALEFDPIKQDIENTKTFLDLNYQDLTRTQQRQADALKISLDRQERNVNFIQSLKKTAWDQLIKSGASPQQVNTLSNASTEEEIGKLFISDVVSNLNPIAYAGVKADEQALVGLLEKYRNFIADKNALQLNTNPNTVAERDGLLSLITAEYKQAKKLGTLDAGVQKLMEGLVGRSNTLSRFSTAAQLKAVDNTLQSFGYKNPGNTLAGQTFFSSILNNGSPSNIYNPQEGFTLPQ